MSKKIIKFAELVNELNEVFDFNNIKGYKLNRLSNRHFQAKEIGLDINFIDIKGKLLDFLPEYLNPKNSFNVSFSINGTDDQAYKTDLKSYLPIMKSVVNVIKEFIQSDDPDLLMIISSDRTGAKSNDPKKDKIYKVLVQKFLPINWTYLEVDNSYGMNHPGVVLYNTNIKTVKFK
jgi:hypothetical protein